MSAKQTERNEKIIQLCNSTDKSMSAIGACFKPALTRNMVVSVVHRARSDGLITRPKDFKGNTRRSKAKKPKPLPIDDAVANPRNIRAILFSDSELREAMAKAVFALRPGQCRWPLALPVPQFAYCENNNDGASCYCSDHHSELGKR